MQEVVKRPLITKTEASKDAAGDDWEDVDVEDADGGDEEDFSDEGSDEKEDKAEVKEEKENQAKSEASFSIISDNPNTGGSSQGNFTMVDESKT